MSASPLRRPLPPATGRLSLPSSPGGGPAVGSAGRLVSSLSAGLAGLTFGVVGIATITLLPAAPAAASGKVGEIVRAFCLSAFQNELSQAGKSAPAGMASYACECVADRISSGSSIETARSDCRQATTRRYRI